MERRVTSGDGGGPAPAARATAGGADRGGILEDDDKAESASESEEDDDDVRPLPFLASIAPDGRSKCRVRPLSDAGDSLVLLDWVRGPHPLDRAATGASVVPRGLRLCGHGLGRHALSKVRPAGRVSVVVSP